MIEVKPNQVFTIDIDGTLCDSSQEFARWREYCVASRCRHWNPSKEDGYEDGCRQGSRNRCIYEADIFAQGIFGSTALMNLSPYPQVREFLEAIEKEKAVSAYIVTGRPESQRQVTIDWMELHKLPTFYMLMRKDTDRRIVPEIKREVIHRLHAVYGEPEQEWICVEDDVNLSPVCEDLGITFRKAPECWE